VRALYSPRVATAEAFHFRKELFNLAGAVAQQPCPAGAAAETNHRQSRILAGGVIPYPIRRHVESSCHLFRRQQGIEGGTLRLQAPSTSQRSHPWAADRCPRERLRRHTSSAPVASHSRVAALPHVFSFRNHLFLERTNRLAGIQTSQRIERYLLVVASPFPGESCESARCLANSFVPSCGITRTTNLCRGCY